MDTFRKRIGYKKIKKTNFLSFYAFIDTAIKFFIAVFFYECVSRVNGHDGLVYNSSMVIIFLKIISP